MAVHNHYKRVEHEVEARRKAAAAQAAAQQAAAGEGRRGRAGARGRRGGGAGARALRSWRGPLAAQPAGVRRSRRGGWSLGQLHQPAGVRRAERRAISHPARSFPPPAGPPADQDLLFPPLPNLPHELEQAYRFNLVRSSNMVRGLGPTAGWPGVLMMGARAGC